MWIHHISFRKEEDGERDGTFKMWNIFNADSLTDLKLLWKFNYSLFQYSCLILYNSVLICRQIPPHQKCYHNYIHMYWYCGFLPVLAVVFTLSTDHFWFIWYVFLLSCINSTTKCDKILPARWMFLSMVQTVANIGSESITNPRSQKKKQKNKQTSKKSTTTNNKNT